MDLLENESELENCFEDLLGSEMFGFQLINEGTITKLHKNIPNFILLMGNDKLAYDLHNSFNLLQLILSIKSEILTNLLQF